MEDKVERNNQVEQLHKKRLKKYEDSLRELQHIVKHDNIQIRNTRRRRKGAKYRKPVWRNNDRKLPEPGEEENQASTGRTGGTNQDEHREAYYDTK